MNKSRFLSISRQGLNVYMNVLTGEGEMTGVPGKEVDKEETPHLSPLPEERKKPERQYSRVSLSLALNSMFVLCSFYKMAYKYNEIV